MRFARGDMRDHNVSHTNDHGVLYWRYGALQWRSWLKITFYEIFEFVRFSTFATLSGVKRKLDLELPRAAFGAKRPFAGMSAWG